MNTNPPALGTHVINRLRLMKFGFRTPSLIKEYQPEPVSNAKSYIGQVSKCHAVWMAKASEEGRI